MAAPTCRTTPNTGHVSSLNTAPAESTTAGSRSSPGNKPYQATEEFVLGLIHSDGYRVVANDRGVKRIRYHFSNRSEDIIGLFTAALDHLEIPWTRSTKYIDSIDRKAATARMDEFIGPKAIAVPWSNVHYTA
jgi:hypothetical protein